jgi:hypothetical protein
MMFPVLLYAQTTGNSDSSPKSFSYELSFESGFGSYLMSDLKDLQDAIINQSNNDIPLLKTTSFPPYFNYSIKFGSFKNKNTYAGFTGGLMSTGARSSLSDYSGYYITDINCMASYLGYYRRTAFENYLILKRPLEIGYILNLSVLYSFVTLKDHLQLYGSEALVDDNNTLNSIGVYTEPLFYANYMFSKHLGIELNAGGAISISSALYYKNMKNNVVIYDKNRYANWSGFRLNIGLITRF